jgi:hypothetical protein
MNRAILRVGIPLLALITAAVHFWLFYNGLSRGRPNYQFLANSAGYIVLIAAFVSNFQWSFISQRIVHYAFMAFAVGSIIAWMVENGGRFLPEVSAITKTIEVVLIIALWLDLAYMERKVPLPASS